MDGLSWPTAATPCLRSILDVVPSSLSLSRVRMPVIQGNLWPETVNSLTHRFLLRHGENEVQVVLNPVGLETVKIDGTVVSRRLNWRRLNRHSIRLQDGSNAFLIVDSDWNGKIRCALERNYLILDEETRYPYGELGWGESPGEFARSAIVHAAKYAIVTAGALAAMRWVIESF